jgi:Asp-tRNA(Asn)/Glu-tRNA(Gln) amidotransferase B subunit
MQHSLYKQSSIKHSAYEAGETVRQETRLWDEKDKASKIMRVKEVFIIYIDSIYIYTGVIHTDTLLIACDSM